MSEPTTCGSVKPDVGPSAYCTREWGHRGDHELRWPDGTFLDSWSAGDPDE